MKTLIQITLCFTIGLCSSSLACDLQTRRLIEREAASADLPDYYLLAIADTLTNCRHDYRDRHGRIGLMGLRPELLPQDIREDPRWLEYPTINVRVAIQVLGDLLHHHESWQTALHIYYQGKEGSSWWSRRWVDKVLGKVAPPPRVPSPRHHPYPGDFDDFGPRQSAPWIPIHRYRPARHSATHMLAPTPVFASWTKIGHKENGPDTRPGTV